MNWFVYMIVASDNSLYTGITTDIQRRWKQHCGVANGGARFFRGRRPVSLAYLESGHNRSSASRREVQIKKLNRQMKIALLQSSENKSESVKEELPTGVPIAWGSIN